MENIVAIQRSQQDPILDFLALFNQIDKHIDKMLKLDKFLPYNEKLKRLIEGEYTISWFIQLHQYQLRYFGEIRNQITHGIKLDGHTYILPTKYALVQLAKYATNIKKPPRCIDIFKKDVYTCHEDDNLKDVVNNMQKFNYSHIPVYNNEERFIGVFTEELIFSWMSKNFSKHKSLEEVKVKSITLATDEEGYIFVGKRTNIYEIDKIFTLKKQNKQKLGAIFMTDTGNNNDKILGVITAGDTALIDTYVIH